MDEAEFRKEYLGIFEPTESIKNVCGECVYFIDGHCSTSAIEAKYGRYNTPSCSEFKYKEQPCNQTE